jgi:tyrosyl-tRNA synthetase
MPPPAFLPVDEQMELLRRGAVDLVDEAQLRSKLERSRRAGTPLTVKTGFDPSSPDLHLGHTVLLRKMRHFQQLGHRVIFLIGGFTARIGDPTGKKATRPQLSEEEVEANARTYLRQVYKVLDEKETVVDNNYRWLGQLGSVGIVQLAGRYTLARIMEREDFRTRFQENRPIHLHELLYPLAQGWDSVVLKADVELGGHDQIFNLLVGRDLMKAEGLEPQVVLTVPLLVGLDGHEKMSKSLGNAIAVEDPPEEIYGKTMSIPDSLLWDWYLLLTDLPSAEIEERRARVAAGSLHPKAVKQELARRLVAQFHGEAAASRAAAEFETVFAAGGVPDKVPERRLAGSWNLAKLLTVADLAGSNAEAHRLIRQGAVSIDGERVNDPFRVFEPRSLPYLAKVGKRRFARLLLTGPENREKGGAPESKGDPGAPRGE